MGCGVGPGRLRRFRRVGWQVSVGRASRLAQARPGRWQQTRRGTAGVQAKVRRNRHRCQPLKSQAPPAADGVAAPAVGGEAPAAEVGRVAGGW